MQLESAGSSVTRNHGTGADANLRLRDVGSTAVNLFDNRVDIIPFLLALVPVLQTDIEGAGRRRLVEGRAATDSHVVQTELRNILDAPFYLACYLSRYGHAGTRGTLYVYIDRAHILVRHKARPGGLEHITQQDADENHRHPRHPSMAEDTQDTTLVLAHNTLKADGKGIMETGRETGVSLLAGTQHQGAEGRGEGHGIDGGDNNRYRHRYAELGIEDAGRSAYEADGDEYAHEHNRCGDKGRSESFHSIHTGQIRRAVPFVELSLHRLHHHYGVVHHRTDDQHQGKEGQQVQAEAYEIKHSKGAYQADHNSQRGDEGASEVLQEDIYHQHHQDDGFQQGAYHIMDAGIQEVLGAHHIHQLHTGRQFLLYLEGRLVDVLDNLVGIRSGCLRNHTVGSCMSVGTVLEGIVLNAQLHTRHILQA